MKNPALKEILMNTDAGANLEATADILGVDLSVVTDLVANLGVSLGGTVASTVNTVLTLLGGIL